MHPWEEVLWYTGQASNVKWISHFPDRWPRESQTEVRGHSRSFIVRVLVLDVWPFVGMPPLVDLANPNCLDDRLPAGFLLGDFVTSGLMSTETAETIQSIEFRDFYSIKWYD